MSASDRDLHCISWISWYCISIGAGDLGISGGGESPRTVWSIKTSVRRGRKRPMLTIRRDARLSTHFCEIRKAPAVRTGSHRKQSIRCPSIFYPQWPWPCQTVVFDPKSYGIWKQTRLSQGRHSLPKLATVYNFNPFWTYRALRRCLLRFHRSSLIDQSINPLHTITAVRPFSPQRRKSCYMPSCVGMDGQEIGLLRSTQEARAVIINVKVKVAHLI